MGVNPRVRAVKPNPDYSLILVFTNDEVRRFDVRPYLDKGVFRALRDPQNFNAVRPCLGASNGGEDRIFAPTPSIKRASPYPL